MCVRARSLSMSLLLLFRFDKKQCVDCVCALICSIVTRKYGILYKNLHETTENLFLLNCFVNFCLGAARSTRAIAFALVSNGNATTISNIAFIIIDYLLAQAIIAAERAAIAVLDAQV